MATSTIAAASGFWNMKAVRPPGESVRGSGGSMMYSLPLAVFRRKGRNGCARTASRSWSPVTPLIFH